jgi:hypothetical protein
MKISYCTWIKNRYPQFRQVYDINLSRLGPDDEWIVVDVDSDDDLSEWVPTDTRVKLHNHAMLPLHFAKLYNVSHRLGNGDYLVNLDADNYLGPKFRDWVQSLQGAVGHSWSQDWHDGTYGRVAIPRQAFYSVGGYDEKLLPCGFQDTDILQRLSHSGWPLRISYDSQVYGGSIPNPREDTMKYVDPSMTFDEYNSRNHQTTLRNLAAKKLRAN